MIAVVIIEDDESSASHLSSLFRELDTEIRIIKVCRTVKESIAFLNTKPDVDLIFSDIQLLDGLSFNIYQETSVECPVIFTSAYDQYLIDTFNYNSIDYILKPITPQSLAHAVRKYNMLRDHFMAKQQPPLQAIMNEFFAARKTRIIVKKGQANISILIADIVLFYTENLLVFALDNRGIKHTVDRNLNQLEADLNPRTFFRANRQIIVNINYVLGYKIYQRVKLLLTMKSTEHIVIVGQEKAKAFRQWFSEG